jgi:hypothetical protein
MTTTQTIPISSPSRDRRRELITSDLRPRSSGTSRGGYLSYVVRRLAAFPSVCWSMANEYDLITSKDIPEWHRLAAIVREEDPFDHLLSIHNGIYPFLPSFPASSPSRRLADTPCPDSQPSGCRHFMTNHRGIQRAPDAHVASGRGSLATPDVDDERTVVEGAQCRHCAEAMSSQSSLRRGAIGRSRVPSAASAASVAVIHSPVRGSNHRRS